jgi:hypothetical protein
VRSSRDKRSDLFEVGHLSNAALHSQCCSLFAQASSFEKSWQSMPSSKEWIASLRSQ